MITNQALSYIIFLTAVVHCVIDFPPYVPKCYQATNDKEASELNECFMLHANESKGFMRDKGIPEISIPPLKKVPVSKIEISQKARSFDYTIVFKDINILGLDDYVVHDVNYIWRNLSMSGYIFVKNIQLTGNYEILGRLFDQPFERKGPLDVNLAGVDLWYQFEYTVYTKNNIKRAKAKYLRMHIASMDDMVGELGNLFGDNNVLNKAANDLISSKQILASVKPEVEKTVLNVLDHLLKALLNIVNYDTLLKPRI